MLTKKQILEQLKRENVNIGSNPGRTFVYYQEMGLLPKSENFLPTNKTVALFPNWTPNLIKNIKKYQREGKKLFEIKKALDESRRREKELKAEEIRNSFEKFAKDFAECYRTWKKLENIAPKMVYEEWWEENHDKPIAEALDRLELKLRGKECKAKDCNNVFVPKRSDRVYCSINCRTRAYHQQKRGISTNKIWQT